MEIEFGKKKVDLKFTFNSFKYMENFDLRELAEIEVKPFKVIPISQQLLLGASNCDKSVKVSPLEVERYIEKAVEEEKLTELVEFLVEELKESSFFKLTQKK